MPPSPPVWVVSAAESAERDSTAIKNGTPSRTLMQRAGAGAATEIIRRYPERVRAGTVVYTGSGNNGGDGWVVARLLSRRGFPVGVTEIVPASTPDAIAERADALDALTAAPVGESALVIDALLGTGAKGSPRGEIANAVQALNSMRANGSKVVALDIPSGLDATTGEHAECVVADLTLSFGGIKRGSLLARDCCGEIAVIDIGLDDSPGNDAAVSAESDRLPLLVDGEWVRSRVAPIRFDAHKGTKKHLAIVGGGPGMAGATVLAARAALRSGVGLLRLAVASETTAAVLSATPSALIAPWPENRAAIKRNIADWADAIVIGPGLGRTARTRELVEGVLADSDLPVLLDADALNIFEGKASSLGALLKGRATILTPHPAEFARLAGVAVEKVLSERFEIGTELAVATGATVLLKGAPTTVFHPDGSRFVVARGTAALGTGGSGDVLAGIAGTLLAQTSNPVTAGCCAAWIHGRAAELCSYVRGTTLDDVLYALPRAWNEEGPPLHPPVLATLPGVG